jgi:hypothetical protein
MRLITFLIIATALFFAGCQEQVEEPLAGHLTISIYNSGANPYDSVFASAALDGNVFWQNRLTLTNNYYQAILDLTPGDGYSVQGWAYIDGLRCYAGASPAFSLELDQQKYLPINMLAQLPTAPWNLQVVDSTSTTMTIAWFDTSTLITGYSIERGWLSRDSLHVVATVDDTASWYYNTGLVPNSWYYYRIRSFNPAGFSSYSNVDSARTKL